MTGRCCMWRLLRFTIVACMLLVCVAAMARPARATLEPPSHVEPTHAAPATTPVSGVIASDTVWSLQGSPYEVTSTVTVQPGVTLTVEPGVEVRFRQWQGLIIRGRLLATGSAAEPVLFTGTSAQPGWWNDIWLSGTAQAPISGTLLDHVVIEYAGHNRGANLRVQHAAATVRNSVIRYSSREGIHALQRGVVDISNTSFTGNGRYAIWFEDGSVDPALSALDASGNGPGSDGSGDVVALGAGAFTLQGAHVWEAAGIPYLVRGRPIVAREATLIVEPGTEARFAQGQSLLVNGRLIARGLEEAPIVFTGSTPEPGWWSGIDIVGSPEVDDAWAELTRVVVEYAGYRHNANVPDANVRVNNGHAGIYQSTIRHSRSHGVYFVNGGASSVIEASHIVGNSGYGVLNRQPTPIVLAANNWWGSPSGPVSDIGCNPGGQGSRVSSGVAFLPFLSDPEEMPGWASGSDSLLLSVRPLRWFAPAGRNSRIWFEITLHDGNGNPVPDREVRLRASHGIAPITYGVTDIEGRSFSYLEALAPGDAEVQAEMEPATVCEIIRAATSTVTFTALEEEGPLEMQAPYFTRSVTVEPMPVVVGVPSIMRFTLFNPNEYPLLVDTRVDYAQLGLGQAFGPLTEILDTHLAPGEDTTIAVPWVPVLPGHYCFQFFLESRPADDPDARPLQSIAQRPQRTQHNVYSGFGSMINPEEQSALEQAREATDWLSLGTTVLDLATSPVSLIVFFVPNEILSTMLDMSFKMYQEASDALRGVHNPPGGSGDGGQQLQALSHASSGSHYDYSPRQDYHLVATFESLPLPQVEPGEDISPERAAAINEFMRAIMDFHVNLHAFTLSYARYQGAAAAEDQFWATRQVSAFMHFRERLYRSAGEASTKLWVLLEVMRAEGIEDMILTPERYAAYQERLREQGFTPAELEAAALLRLTDAELEEIRQERLAQDPEAVAGSLVERLERLVGDLGRLAHAFRPPTSAFGSGPSARMLMTSGDYHNLVRSFDHTTSFLVGNPLPETATVELRVRRIDLPPDWTVLLETPSLTLAPGEEVRVSATIQPGTAARQGSVPRAAVEGYISGELIGGVVLDILLPEEAPYEIPTVIQVHALTPRTSHPRALVAAMLLGLSTVGIAVSRSKRRRTN
jgi:hypothetical protein